MPKTFSLLAAALCAAMLLSAGPRWCAAAEKQSAEQRIEEELEKPSRLEFIETPLQDVIDFLKEKHKIEIQIDRKALDDVGLDPSTTPISKNLKGLSLRSALQLTLRDLDLTYVIQDEVLLITTPEEAETRVTTKFYPIGDLVGSDNAEDQRRQCDELVDAIIGSIGDSGWDATVGRPGWIATTSFRGVPTLVVSQGYHVHRKVAAFLEEQRRVIRAAVPRCRVLDTHRTPAAERIEKALKEPTELEFIETPLQDVLDYLKSKHKIEIQIDRKALDDVGLGPSTTPITKNLKGISLRSALELTLRDLDLTYVIQDEVLLITTPEEAETRLTTRVYPVGDLWGSFRLPATLPSFTGIPVVGTWSEHAEPPQNPARPAESEADPSPESAPAAPAAAPRVGTLADMVSRIVEPTTWEEVGGPGSIIIGSVGGVDVLIVSQTQEVHEQILALLDTLREAVRCSRSATVPAAKHAEKPTTAERPEAPPPPEPPGDPFEN